MEFAASTELIQRKFDPKTHTNINQYTHNNPNPPEINYTPRNRPLKTLSKQQCDPKKVASS